MSDSSLLVVGAHPDDCTIKAGGIAATYVDAGRDVTFLSLTDGSAGHHEQDRQTVAARRQRETAAVAETLGVDYEVFDVPDGELTADLDTRADVIRFVRRVDPDLILAPRPNDYHPDHRAAAALVRDAAYMLVVPNVCPDVEPLADLPVVGYVADRFRKPAPFEPDVVLAVDDVSDRKLDALACHESQVYEWLPYTFGILDDVPDDPDQRRAWLESAFLDHLRANTPISVADDFRDRLIERYGERGETVEHAEAVEISEYGAPLTDDLFEELFFF
jgi:LmbE family N-acetylglucosaminyl deacetylase